MKKICLLLMLILLFTGCVAPQNDAHISTTPLTPSVGESELPSTDVPKPPLVTPDEVIEPPADARAPDEPASAESVFIPEHTAPPAVLQEPTVRPGNAVTPTTPQEPADAPNSQASITPKEEPTAAPISESTAPESEKDSSIVYWTPNGEVWHSIEDCRSLARSKDIRSGTKQQSGKSRSCNNCVR